MGRIPATEVSRHFSSQVGQRARFSLGRVPWDNQPLENESLVAVVALAESPCVFFRDSWVPRGNLLAGLDNSLPAGLSSQSGNEASAFSAGSRHCLLIIIPSLSSGEH